MITISRRQALHLRSVLRRAFGTLRNKKPVVAFIGDKAGLTVRSMVDDVAVECRIPGERTAETINLPLEFLADVEGKKDDPVDLEAAGNDQVNVSWQAGSVPQVVKYMASQPVDDFPATPSESFTNRPGLLQALHEASDATDAGSLRFALGCLQLCKDGSINATDGRQLLIQQGFSFPWQDDVLVPRSKVFASPELPQDQPVSVGQSGDWAVVGAGRWTIYLKINKDGKFPNLSRYLMDLNSAKSRCHFSKDDMQFLAQTLPELPCEESQNYPVTIDLNGHVAVRAKAADQDKPTEVVLTNSRWTGEPCRININRMYLQKAVKLGLSELCLYGKDSPLSGVGIDRRFVWMPLTSESAIPPAEDAIRITSPEGEIAAVATQPVTPRTTQLMNEPTTNSSKTASTAKTEATNKTPRRKAAKQDLAAVIEQVLTIRSELRDSLGKTNELVKSLKQHRRQNRAVQQTIEQLRTLKSLGV